jgi:histidyl-tRNA synthetase
MHQVRLNMGLARGLNYYTGLVFEIHSEAGQLCGGGRYDEFIRVLGAAADTPAVGFVYGIERILSHLRTNGAALLPAVEALVVPVDDEDDAEAARVAMRLRTGVHGAIVELYAPPTRNLSQVLARANKRGTPYVIIIGEAERANGTVMIRDMQAGTQYTCTVDELIALIGAQKEPGRS